MKIDPLLGLFLAIGVVLIVGGLYQAWRTRRFLAGAEETDGSVIALKEIDSRDADGPSYAPVVRFLSSSGRQIVFTDGVSSNPAGHEIRQTVRVAYDPDQPDSTACVTGTWRTYLMPMIMLFIGIMFIVIGGKDVGIPAWEAARAVLAASDSHVGQFGGRWRNMDPAASGITRIEIESKWPVVQIKAWRKCHPVDCEWGMPESYNNSFVSAGDLRATWRTNFAHHMQRMTLLPDGRMQVETHTHFTDSSRRADYDSTEMFRRE